MDEIFGAMGNVIRLMAGVGAGIAAIAFCWSGYQWMTAAGDPQQVGRARMTAIGSLAGLVMIGMAFIAPRVVSEFVTEPVGGIPVVDIAASNNCDDVLRSQLVFQTAASDDDRMNRLIGVIQSRYGECGPDVWPVAVSTVDGGDLDLERCFGGGDKGKGVSAMIGGHVVPAGLRDGGVIKGMKVRGTSGRDARNNILVYFHSTNRPNDGSKCWLYISRLNSWFENY